MRRRKSKKGAGAAKLPALSARPARPRCLRRSRREDHVDARVGGRRAALPRPRRAAVAAEATAVGERRTVGQDGRPAGLGEKPPHPSGYRERVPHQQGLKVGRPAHELGGSVRSGGGGIRRTRISSRKPRLRTRPTTAGISFSKAGALFSSVRIFCGPRPRSAAATWPLAHRKTSAAKPLGASGKRRESSERAARRRAFERRRRVEHPSAKLTSNEGGRGQMGLHEPSPAAQSSRGSRLRSLFGLA